MHDILPKTWDPNSNLKEKTWHRDPCMREYGQESWWHQGAGATGKEAQACIFFLAFLFLSGRENYKLLHSPGEATNTLLGNWNTSEILVEFTFFHFLLMVTAPQTEGVVKEVYFTLQLWSKVEGRTRTDGRGLKPYIWMERRAPETRQARWLSWQIHSQDHPLTYQSYKHLVHPQ